jgi:hypothetical protein
LNWIDFYNLTSIISKNVWFTQLCYFSWVKIITAVYITKFKRHIVRINDYWLDIVPVPGSYFLFSDHRDRPGLIGTVGKITGDANINISAMHVSRLKPREQALMILDLDEPVDATIETRIAHKLVSR